MHHCIIWKMIHSLVLHTLDQPTLHKHFESHSMYIYIIPLHWTSLNHLGINESSPPPPFPTSPGPNGKSTSQRRGQGPRLTCRLSRLKLLQWTTSHPRQRWRPTVPHGKKLVLIKHDQTKLNYPLNQLLVKQYLGFLDLWWFMFPLCLGLIEASFLLV